MKRETGLTLIWILGVIACIIVVILLQVLKPLDWFIHATQAIVIAKMIGFTYMYKDSFTNGTENKVRNNR